MNLISNFIEESEARVLEHWLQTSDQITWQQEYFKIYGREVSAPRQIAWFGDPGLNYRYTQLDHRTNGWPEPLADLRQRIQREVEQPFNFLLLNKYVDGSQYMGWHKDDEAGCIGQIASVSLGAVRRFAIERVPQGSTSEGAEVVRESIDLANGSLLFFDGRQRHCLRATKRPVGSRVNLTFRNLAS